jgi:hypothetical protein
MPKPDQHQLNPTIKHLVLNYLEYKGVEVTPYKEDPDYYYFANPFHGQPGQIPTYRQVTFENSASIKKERIEFINIDHPLLVAIQRELEQHSQQGRVAAFRAAINKFQTSGILVCLSIDHHQQRRQTQNRNGFVFYGRRRLCKSPDKPVSYGSSSCQRRHGAELHLSGRYSGNR